MSVPIRTRLGTLLFDRPRFAWPLWLGGRRDRWLGFRNRGERLLAAPDGIGFALDARWSSRLTLCRAWPGAARSLLRVALTEWPIHLAPLGDAEAIVSETPEVSFVVGHRGEPRIPHLLLTLRSLLGQQHVPFEVIVVEQDVEPRLESLLPKGVRLLTTRPPRFDMPYSRSWAFNVGVRAARGRTVVLHDNDTLAPAAYGILACQLAADGWEGARFQRFVFYLDRTSTDAVLSRGELCGPLTDEVVQNSEGGTLAVCREAYCRIGGHDEDFVGWGGEDNEFFDRCRALRFRPWGYLPFVHLCHDRQPRASANEEANSLLKQKLAIPREARIASLAARHWGDPSGPSPCPAATEGR